MAEKKKDIEVQKNTAPSKAAETTESVSAAGTTVADQAPAERQSADPRQDRSARGRRPQRERDDRRGNINPDIEERVVMVNRTAKVVKGGRRFGFAALVVVGDKKGKVGFGLGKAKEVPEAIRKGKQIAERNMVQVTVENGTIPHEVIGHFDAGKIVFRPAAEGTGVKASGACRAVLELAGVRNVLTKSLRGNNPHNIVKATFHALRSLRTAKEIAEARNIDQRSLRVNL
jgi:small subunit ribosomal protein S5